jgi:hypothetical protein
MDAVDLVESLRGHTGRGKTYGQMHATTLVDTEGTKGAILNAMRGLARMQPDDVAVVLLAGHGVLYEAKKPDHARSFKNEGEKWADYSARMLFLPSSAGTDAERWDTEAITWNDFADELNVAQGRVILLLDACHAGSMSPELFVPNSAFVRALTHSGRAGTIVFAASKGRQQSIERGWNGLFTGSFVRAMSSTSTDRNHDGQLQISELIAATTADVIALTNGTQVPRVARQEIVGDFVLVPAPESTNRP